MTEIYFVLTFLFISILFVWLLFLNKKTSTLQLKKKELVKAIEENRLDEVMELIRADLNGAINSLDELKGKHEKLEKINTNNISRIGMVRFNAFNDVGGELSFALALLNEIGDGAVISVINGRQESRIYAKTIRDGKASHQLSGEERRAIIKAIKR